MLLPPYTLSKPLDAIVKTIAVRPLLMASIAIAEITPLVPAPPPRQNATLLVRHMKAIKEVLVFALVFGLEPLGLF